MDNTIGLQVRNDNIQPVVLYHTEARQILSTIRLDKVVQTGISVYGQNRFQWAEKFRTIAGIREDFYYWDVKSDNPLNSGNAHDSIASPKLGLIFGPWEKTEYYINAGYGYHSNDARGTTITVDPQTGDSVQKVKPLVRAKGMDIGARTAAIPHLQNELTFWVLDLDSELLFTGDAGITEPSRPSRRYGVEWANYYTPTPWFALDADLALSRARFTESVPVGNYIPGSPDTVFSLGASVDNVSGFLGSLRLRYFGPRPLIEDNSVRSQPSTLINARIGYEFNKTWRVALDVFNVFDAKVSDIDYYYVSRLPGEPAGGVADIHTHPEDSREARLTLSANF
jgi:outer membrane receptor protein involved in Fe transport